MSQTPSPRILVVEDDASMRNLVAEELQEAGYQVMTAASVSDARDRLMESTPDLVVSDLRLPDGSGIDLLEHVRRQPAGRTLGFVLITGFGTIEQAVSALKKDADDFLTKPLDFDHLRLSVGRVLENIRLRRELHGYEALHGREGFRGMVGNSPPMQRLYEAIERVAVTEAPVLIRGESGTGKELVARAIHEESGRHRGPFIAVNCASVPADLLETEFFGHRRGAFTGAAHDRVGLVAAADGGTLFLDEIGEMPMALQAKLLRVLEDGSLRPVGADEETRGDVRIVAATHRDLERAVTDGDFREDLYYRLDTFTIPVPPLRDRAEDIGTLAAGFLAAGAKRQGQEPPDITIDAMEALQLHDWPGNVRELANAMERALAFCDGTAIRQRDLPGRVGETRLGAEPQDPAGERTLTPLADVEAAHIRRVLQAVGGNRRRAAEILGIGRRTLYRKLQEDGQ